MPKYELTLNVEARDTKQAEQIKQCIKEILKNLDFNLLDNADPEKVGQIVGKVSSNPGLIKTAAKIFKIK